MKKTPEQIIKEYSRYINTIANRMGQELFFDDMVQVGRLAAIQAYERLDESKINDDEKSYITTCIKGSIMNFLTNNARTIHIPANKLVEHTIPTISINIPLNDEGDTLEDVIPSSDTYIYPEQNNALKTLYFALDKLKPEYREIIELYYDLGDNSNPMTLREIAAIKNQTHQNIADKLNKAIKKLQKIMIENK